MKSTSLTIGLTALLLATLASFAADKPSVDKAVTDRDQKTPTQQAAKQKEAKAKAAKPERVAVTGSYIKQKVDRNGVIASALPSPVLIIDCETIRRTGASDIPDLFRKGGWAH